MQQAQTSHVNQWENMFQSKGELGWWENGRYVLDPEGFIIQIWYFFSNICFFLAIGNISSHFAFDLQTVNYN